MGKIKVRTLGDEGLENKQKEISRLAGEAKRAKQKAHEKKLVKGGKGGERIVSVGPSEEELAKIKLPAENIEEKPEVKTTKAKKVSKKAKKAPHSKSYQKVMATLDRSKKYKLTDALDMLEKLKRSKFDETVELHINTIEMGVSGNITLPHGTGKEIKVAIADDDLLSKVAQGKIDFDILLAKPEMMPKLARVAKILGPKGLMPNPKNATLVKDPEKAALEFKKGQINFRTELKAPIMHLMVGKMSFGAQKLAENIQALIEAIKKDKIRNVTLKSTMSPGIKLEL
jgi:large subunit ribosomal protein L1